MINAAAYLQACQLPGSQSFQLSLLKERIFTNSAAKSDAPDLTNIPEEYHEFANVFSQEKVETLPAHHPYNLKINLKEGAEPPPGHMYSLSPSELGAFQTFVEDNVRTGFIRPSNSPHGAPILFIKKKDGSL